MIKIIHIHVSPKLTGCQQISYDILTHLPAEYDRHIMFSAPVNKEFREFFESHGITVHESKFLRRDISIDDFRAFYELFTFFRKNKFDIVHTNSTKPGVIARVAAKIAGCKVVVHTVHGIAFHSFISYPKRVLFYLLELIACLFGNFNITVNKSYLKYFPRFVASSSCIYNGVDFHKLEKKEKKGTQVCVGFFARLDEQKAPDIFIKIVHLLIQKGIHNVRFVLAGDGELLSSCKEMISHLSLNDKIEVLGWIDSKSEFLSEVDILVQPSRWEAFGLSVVEAAFFEIPTVASNVEGLPEVIIDGKTGYVCKTDDIDDFSNKIYQLIINDHLRKKMGLQAKEYVEANFNLESMVDNYISLYKATFVKDA